MQPVILGHEHGITFASSDDDAFNLSAPVAGPVIWPEYVVKHRLSA